MSQSIKDIIGTNIKIAIYDSLKYTNEIECDLKVSFVTLSNYIRGTICINAERLYNLSKYLDKEIAWFFIEHPLDREFYIKLFNLHKQMIKDTDIRIAKRIIETLSMADLQQYCLSNSVNYYSSKYETVDAILFNLSIRND